MGSSSMVLRALSLIAAHGLSKALQQHNSTGRCYMVLQSLVTVTQVALMLWLEGDLIIRASSLTAAHNLCNALQQRTTSAKAYDVKLPNNIRQHFRVAGSTCAVLHVLLTASAQPCRNTAQGPAQSYHCTMWYKTQHRGRCGFRPCSSAA
jgi:hypothetical protein